MLWDLWKEVFNKYRDEWLEERKKKPWKENLFFIPLIIALVVLLVIIFQTFIYPGRPTLF